MSPKKELLWGLWVVTSIDWKRQGDNSIKFFGDFGVTGMSGRCRTVRRKRCASGKRTITVRAYRARLVGTAIYSLY